VAPMADHEPHGQWRLADGSYFRWTARTLLLDVSMLPLDPPARTLHINETSAVAVPAEGKPWRVSPERAVEIVGQLNDARRGTGVPLVALPKRFMRAARHTAVINTATLGGLPFPVLEAAGYPGRTTPNETLWIHSTTGAVALETDDTPAKFTPTEAATGRAIKVYRRIGVRAATAWLDREGYNYHPAVLRRRPTEPGVDDDPPHGD